ncbi:MAG: DUF1573 domain-containing protein [Candidatus Kapabacteria bacterium]|nr:DUF1573 domain-containing protein [Candidatus Kapabacteria bacterium]
MKKLFLMVAAIALIFSIKAKSDNTVQPAAKASKIEIDGGDTYNWGKVKPEKLPLKAIIKIFNRGNDTLKIGEVKPGCGCTTAPLDKKDIEPGGFASLNVTINVNNDGKITKSITIHSNDPHNESKILMLEAEITRALARYPQFLSFQPVDLNKQASAEMTLKNNSDVSITIKDVKVEPEGATTNLKHNDVIAPGADYKVKVSYTPTKFGGFTCKLNFKTDHPEVPSVESNGWGTVNQPAPELKADSPVVAPAPVVKDGTNPNPAGQIKK